MGRHSGIINFTVGQRKGLGISNSVPLYVIRLDPIKAQVIVGPREFLKQQSLIVKDVNWLGPRESKSNDIELKVKLRSAQRPLSASVNFLEANRAMVTLNDNDGAVAPGQACVFYDQNRVMGGGWILRED